MDDRAQMRALNLDPDDYELLAGDASSRRYFRDRKNQQLLCLDTESSFAITHFVQVTQALARKNIAVAKIERVLKNNAILIEDLGDVDLLKAVSGKLNGKSLDLYKRAIDILIVYHALKAEDFHPYKIENYLFDQEKLTQEIEHTNEYFLRRLCQNISEDKILLMRDELIALIKMIVRKDEFVPCHRDYHGRNIMMCRGDLYLIDYQDSRLGLRQYDLCSLVDDCYLRGENKIKEMLIRYYFEAAALKQNYDEFLELYQLVKIQRLFKAIGSFAMLFVEKKKSSYLQYIPQSLENLIATMKEENRCPQAAAILEKAIYAR